MLAYQTDLTRVITLMLGREFSGMTYPQIAVPDAHHPISHHALEPEKIAKVAKINAYHVSLFAALAEKMRNTPEGDGTMLDHSLFLYGSGLGDGDQHASVNNPTFLVGGANGRLKGGRHLVYRENTRLMNLGVSILDTLQIEGVNGIGDSTGRLAGI